MERNQTRQVPTIREVGRLDVAVQDSDAVRVFDGAIVYSSDGLRYGLC